MSIHDSNHSRQPSFSRHGGRWNKRVTAENNNDSPLLTHDNTPSTLSSSLLLAPPDDNVVATHDGGHSRKPSFSRHGGRWGESRSHSNTVTLNTEGGANRDALSVPSSLGNNIDDVPSTSHHGRQPSFSRHGGRWASRTVSHSLTIPSDSKENDEGENKNNENSQSSGHHRKPSFSRHGGRANTKSRVIPSPDMNEELSVVIHENDDNLSPPVMMTSSSPSITDSTLHSRKPSFGRHGGRFAARSSPIKPHIDQHEDIQDLLLSPSPPDVPLHDHQHHARKPSFSRHGGRWNRRKGASNDDPPHDTSVEVSGAHSRKPSFSRHGGRYNRGLSTTPPPPPPSHPVGVNLTQTKTAPIPIPSPGTDNDGNGIHVLVPDDSNSVSPESSPSPGSLSRQLDMFIETTNPIVPRDYQHVNPHAPLPTGVHVIRVARSSSRSGGRLIRRQPNRGSSSLSKSKQSNPSSAPSIVTHSSSSRRPPSGGRPRPPPAIAQKTGPNPPPPDVTFVNPSLSPSQSISHDPPLDASSSPPSVHVVPHLVFPSSSLPSSSPLPVSSPPLSIPSSSSRSIPSRPPSARLPSNISSAPSFLYTSSSPRVVSIFGLTSTVPLHSNVLRGSSLGERPSWSRNIIRANGAPILDGSSISPQPIQIRSMRVHIPSTVARKNQSSRQRRIDNNTQATSGGVKTTFRSAPTRGERSLSRARWSSHSGSSIQQSRQSRNEGRVKAKAKENHRIQTLSQLSLLPQSQSPQSSSRPHSSRYSVKNIDDGDSHDDISLSGWSHGDNDSSLFLRSPPSSRSPRPPHPHRPKTAPFRTRSQSSQPFVVPVPPPLASPLSSVPSSTPTTLASEEDSTENLNNDTDLSSTTMISPNMNGDWIPHGDVTFANYQSSYRNDIDERIIRLRQRSATALKTRPGKPPPVHNTTTISDSNDVGSQQRDGGSNVLPPGPRPPPESSLHDRHVDIPIRTHSFDMVPPAFPILSYSFPSSSSVPSHAILSYSSSLLSSTSTSSAAASASPSFPIPSSSMVNDDSDGNSGNDDDEIPIDSSSAMISTTSSGSQSTTIVPALNLNSIYDEKNNDDHQVKPMDGGGYFGISSGRTSSSLSVTHPREAFVRPSTSLSITSRSSRVSSANTRSHGNGGPTSGNRSGEPVVFSMTHNDEDEYDRARVSRLAARMALVKQRDEHERPIPASNDQQEEKEETRIVNDDDDDDNEEDSESIPIPSFAFEVTNRSSSSSVLSPVSHVDSGRGGRPLSGIARTRYLEEMRNSSPSGSHPNGMKYRVNSDEADRLLSSSRYWNSKREWNNRIAAVEQDFNQELPLRASDLSDWAEIPSHPLLSKELGMD